MRQHAKRKMRERQRFVFVGGAKIKRGARCEFRAIHPEYGVILSGWFIADSDNPVCHVLWRVSQRQVETSPQAPEDPDS